MGTINKTRIGKDSGMESPVRQFAAWLSTVIYANVQMNQGTEKTAY
jgi:hypothetical protein